MDQIPCIIGLNYIGKRRHGRPVHTGHEDPVEILIRRAALKAGVITASGEIIGTDRLSLLSVRVASGGPVTRVPAGRGISSIPSSGRTPAVRNALHR